MRRLRRQLRHALNVRRWSIRQKIAVGIWIPVLVAAFVLFTGPNRSSGAASAVSAPTTTTSFEATVPPLEPIVPPGIASAPKTSLNERIVKWINGVPTKKSAAEVRALLKYKAAHSRTGTGAQTSGPKVVITHAGSGRARTAKH